MAVVPTVYIAPERRNKRAFANVRSTKDSTFFTTTKHPWQSRKALSEDYDAPVTEREGWWRTEIRETPLPGSYNTTTFLQELKVRPNTYRFKSDGRKVDPDPYGKGSLLLPGAYETDDFLQWTERKPATYNFRAVSRDAAEVQYYGKPDKNINVSPAAYETERYLSMATEKAPSKHFMFKSQMRRFPTTYFKPKEGPGPGNYEQHSQTVPGISSSFRSKTPRFTSSHTKVPGPGTYEKTFQNPMRKTISKMGRQYGLFFSSAFES